MAALCGLGNMDGLIGKVCIKHDLNIGVYGFVFFRGMRVTNRLKSTRLTCTNMRQMVNGNTVSLTISSI